MTPQEAREFIIKERDSLKANSRVKVKDCLYEAFDFAIEALEQQPCEDCISREDTIEAIQDKYYDNAIGIDIVDMIAHMPAAIPEQLGEHFAKGYKKGIENE